MALLHPLNFTWFNVVFSVKNCMSRLVAKQENEI